jgi:hypothetical protein
MTMPILFGLWCLLAGWLLSGIVPGAAARGQAPLAPQPKNSV